MKRYLFSEAAKSFRTLPAAALRAVFREGYRSADFRNDLTAGVVVGTVALPLGMALAIGVGVAPQHGLYTAIIAGFIVALLGGSRTQVSGPTAAFIVILAPIYLKFGVAGLLVSGLMSGFMLIAMGLLRLGPLIQFIPHPVTTGFTAGIATVIAVLQLKDLTGLTFPRPPHDLIDRLWMMFVYRGTASGWEIALGLSTLILLLWFPRLTTRVRSPIVVLPAMTLVSIAIRHFADVEFATIGSRFETQVGDETIRGIPPLPPLPVLPWRMEGPSGTPFRLDFATIQALIPEAFAIAILGAIESLLSAVVADGMARTKHDPDAELLALGIGNVVTPFFGGIAATGAVARTATNIRSGAKSPIAAMIHALVVLLAVIGLAPVLGYLPMASLAGLLLLVAWDMSEAKHFLHTIRVAPKSDVAVMLTCYGLTVAFDMVIGVTVGVVLAAFLFMRRMAEVTEARLASQGELELPGPIPEGVAVYEISGPLFFGAAQKAMATLNRVPDRSRVVILRMDEVNAMDGTGLVALESALTQLKKLGCLAILSHVRSQPMSVLKRAGLLSRANVLVSPDIRDAFAMAEKHLNQ